MKGNWINPTTNLVICQFNLRQIPPWCINSQFQNDPIIQFHSLSIHAQIIQIKASSLIIIWNWNTVLCFVLLKLSSCLIIKRTAVPRWLWECKEMVTKHRRVGRCTAQRRKTDCEEKVAEWTNLRPLGLRLAYGDKYFKIKPCGPNSNIKCAF